MIRVLLLLSVFWVSQTMAATVYLTRHYEKASGNDPVLTSEGMQRAQKLAATLSKTPFDHILTTDYKRTRQTVAPIAQQRNQNVEVYDASSSGLKMLAERIRASDGHYLVAGHSNTTPELIALLGGPSITIEESDYGDLFILELTAGEVEYEKQYVAK